MARSAVGSMASTWLTVATTSGAWITPTTRVPVSAALIAVSSASGSWMSPATITSGSCRRAARRPT